MERGTSEVRLEAKTAANASYPSYQPRKAIMSFSYTPLEMITWLGLGVVGFSGLAIVVQLFLRLMFPDIAPKGFTSLILLILFLGDIQMLCLNSIESYLAHIYVCFRQDCKGRKSRQSRLIFRRKAITQAYAIS